MASQVTPEGHVLPPLNISAAAPALNLKGFEWGTVDQKILGLPQHEQHEVFKREEAPSTITTTATTITPTPSASTSKAPLPGELGLVAGVSTAAPPLFPLAQFRGTYAGNGFNNIFRPRGKGDTTRFPISIQDSEDNILELNLTTEQWTFGATIGDIPNRGLNLNDQPDITLQGFPYLQTVQDVTNPATGKGNNVVPTDIHFEAGMWLNVPASGVHPKNAASVVRMASIPHGTTINAQCLAPILNKASTLSGGRAGRPDFDAPENVLDTTPFFMSNKKKVHFPSMDATNPGTPRIPQNLENFVTEKTITTDIIKNPNLVLQKAIQGQNIAEFITFEVSTGPPNAALNGGGTTNISFLAGKQNPVTTAAPDEKGTPNAHAAFMTSKFWIEIVQYQVTVPPLTTRSTITLKPTMPTGSTAPTPQFLIKPPARLPTEAKTITIPGIQIQYSQTVNLNFGPRGNILTWPHVSVATLVPTAPQPFSMT
ncbi:hypothetical protein MMC10_001416 [Thelotrema lepadinum]|nr:hypothetical protein [Thelotrema lepadinum]